MISAEQMNTYYREGYAILEDVIPSEQLAQVQQSYEETIEEALRLGLAKRDGGTGFLQGHRFQNPHHPALAQRALMEALSAPTIMEFAHQIFAGDIVLHGIAAFAMNRAFDYQGRWHRDSYEAWGKDSPAEKRVRLMDKMPATQILLALEDDECFWFVPRSHNRANSAEEEARFVEQRTGSEELFTGAVQLQLRAGSAVPFDARGIHRGLKFPGEVRRSLFIVYGTGEEGRHSSISDWAREPDYAQEQYLDALPKAFRRAAERTIEFLKKD